MKYTHPSEEKNLDARTFAFQNFSTQLPEERLNVGPANIGRNGSGKYQLQRTLMLSFHFMMVAENGIKKTPAIRSFCYSYDAPASPSALTPGIKARECPKTTFPRRSVGTIKIIAVFPAVGTGRGKLSGAISSAGSVPRTGPAWLRQRRSQHCCSSSGALLRRGFWLQWPWLRRGLWREPPCRQAG